MSGPMLARERCVNLDAPLSAAAVMQRADIAEPVLVPLRRAAECAHGDRRE